MNRDDRERDGNLAPIMALPLGPLFGLLFGVLLGVVLLDNIPAGIGIGLVVGFGAGTAVYLFLELAGNHGEDG